jgi:hypothetical protein
MLAPFLSLFLVRFGAGRRLQYLHFTNESNEQIKEWFVTIKIKSRSRPISVLASSLAGGGGGGHLPLLAAGIKVKTGLPYAAILSGMVLV